MRGSPEFTSVYEDLSGCWFVVSNDAGGVAVRMDPSRDEDEICLTAACNEVTALAAWSKGLLASHGQQGQVSRCTYGKFGPK